MLFVKRLSPIRRVDALTPSSLLLSQYFPPGTSFFLHLFPLRELINVSLTQATGTVSFPRTSCRRSVVVVEDSLQFSVV